MLGLKLMHVSTVYPKKYTHGFCFAVLCCGYTLTDFPIFIRLTSLALWQSNDCPSASKATLMNMDKYFMWIHYERLHNHNKAKHNKTMCIFLGIYCKRGHSDEVTANAFPLTLNYGWKSCNNWCSGPVLFLCHVSFAGGALHNDNILLILTFKPPGPRLNIKTVLSAYGDFHVKDKTAVRTSYL